VDASEVEEEDEAQEVEEGVALVVEEAVDVFNVTRVHPPRLWKQATWLMNVKVN